MRICLLVCALLAIFGTGTARAHAHLDHTEPPIGSTVSVAPHELSLWFTQKLEPAFSTVTVTDDQGTPVDQGEPQISGNTVRVGLKSLGPGTYHVRWHAVSVDTHITEGSFLFIVSGP